jgi:formylglycine-generating enzyme required for sulfatase activity
MGSHQESAAELPVHSVKVGAFALSRTEVTWREFQTFAAATNLDNTGITQCMAIVHGQAVQPDLPAFCVTWHEAQAYASWLAALTGKHYHLPSEAQWEYAARRGSRHSRRTGVQHASKGICDVANVRELSDLKAHGPPRGAAWAGHDCDDGHAGIAPVASLRGDELGLHDMLGNVQEWTSDCAHFNYRGAPIDGTAWLRAAGASESEVCLGFKVLRGGGWASGKGEVSESLRNWLPPESRQLAAGFRVAR